MERQAAEAETELKFALTERSAAALRHHPALAAPRAEPPDLQHLRSTYLDTPDRSLAQRGIGLRVRRSGDRLVQTVKSAGASGVAAQRGEWEWDVATERPDLTRLKGTPAAELIAPALAARLRPCFVTVIERTAWTVRCGDAVVEVALDRNHVRAGRRRTPVLELELELKAGGLHPLYRLALELHQAVPLRIEPDTKAARGLRLVTGASPQVAKSTSLAVGPDGTAASAFHTLVMGHLGQLIANQPAVRAGQVEGVHQMRVALRRVRASLALFTPLLDRPTVRRFTGQLRQLGRVMGHARDWDVFCCDILPGAIESSGGQGAEGLATLRAPAEQCRAAARATLLRVLDRPEFTSTVLELAAWVEEGIAVPSALGPDGPGQRFSDVWPALLRRLARKTAKRGKRLAALSDADRHAFRKSLKRLRYALDALSPLLPEEKATPCLRRAKKLLKHLGGANDAITGVALANTLVKDGQPDLAPALGALERHLKPVRKKAVRHLARDWHALADGPVPWQG